MEFELRELEYFVALAEELNFKRAAERVGINPSPLSKSIRNLEERLGNVKLFERNRKSTRLTHCGVILHKDALRIFAEVDRAQRNIASALTGRYGQLKLAVTAGLATSRFASLLAQSRLEDPELEISVEERTWQEQERELRSEAIDLGFAAGLSPEPGRNEIVQDDLLITKLWSEREVIALHPDHPLAQSLTVKSSEINPSHGPFLLLTSVVATWNKPIVALAEIVNNYKFIRSIDLLLALVESGSGMGLIMAPYADCLERHGVVFRAFEYTKGPRVVTTYAIHRRDATLAAIGRFIERARGMTPPIAGVSPKG